MRDAERPIGVFDSGVGGLTVFKALARRMPAEHLIYFGDTAHVPYGSKSKETVTRYSTAIARFLRERRIKLLVVACNTSSALALPDIQKAVDVPVIGVIQPGARAASQATRKGAVGIIGTEATIASGAYEQALRHERPAVRTAAAACPLFVPLVEEGWWRHAVTSAVAREYLAPLRKAGVDTLVLGCTHYPLLKPAIAKIMGAKVRLIDSAEQTAAEADELLESMKLRRRGKPGRREFFCSDAPQRFARLARRLGIEAGGVRLHPFEI